ncbi:MAG: ester cyclase [Ferruginibacter sp.]
MKQLIIVTAAVIFIISGCNNSNKIDDDNSKKKVEQENREEKNKQVALQCIRAWSNGDIDEIVKHLAQNTADYGDESTPPATGIDSVKFFAETWNSSVKDYKADHELAVADSDYVFVYAGWSGTFKSDFMGMKTTGKSFKFKDVDIFKFDDKGKITEHRAVHFSTVLRQLATETK